MSLTVLLKQEGEQAWSSAWSKFLFNVPMVKELAVDRLGSALLNGETRLSCRLVQLKFRRLVAIKLGIAASKAVGGFSPPTSQSQIEKAMVNKWAPNCPHLGAPVANTFSCKKAFSPRRNHSGWSD